MNNYNYNFTNPYSRNYGMQYAQPQYAPQPQQMQQPQMAQQQMQYELPIQYVGYANLKETEAHILFPNQKAIFIDKANGMVYEKICNQDGQSFITQFKRVDESEKHPIETPKEQPTIDLSMYAKKEDLGSFVGLEQYNKLMEKFEQLQKQIIGVKTNVGTSKQQ